MIFKTITFTTVSAVAAALVTVLSGNVAQAATFRQIRIGDVDGFGFDPTNLKAANGGAADVNGNGILESGEYLPNLGDRQNQGRPAVGSVSNDDFDNRTDELSNTFLAGQGYVDQGSSGSALTDIALSTSHASKMNELVDLGYQKDRKLPARRFVFDFTADQVNADVPFFFNLIFGDYDVAPAEVKFTRADDSTFTESLIRQNNRAGGDGLIQSAFLELSFEDIFTRTGSGYEGYLMAELVAPDEPYLAIDYVELSTQPVNQDVPEPTMTFGLLALGWVGTRFLRRQKN